MTFRTLTPRFRFVIARSLFFAFSRALGLRRHALADLDRTAIEGIGLSIAWLKAGGKPVDEESLLAYADLRARYYGGRTSEQTAGEP